MQSFEQRSDVICLGFSKDFFGSVLRIDCGGSMAEPAGPARRLQQGCRRERTAGACLNPAEGWQAVSFGYNWKDEPTESFDDLMREGREKD